MQPLRERNAQAGYVAEGREETVRVGPMPDYVLMTAAYNEEAHIERMIMSVLSQTVLPKRWVIVSDGSVDKTDDIIRGYAVEHDFIRFMRRTRPPGRSFGSKARALIGALKFLEDVQYEFIGNVDADVWLEPSFFEDLLNHFNRRPSLGLAGGQFFEEDDEGEFKSRELNRTYSVTHAAQLVRRDCYQAIGGYAVLEYGGEDWHAEVTAKMKGWEIESFPALKIFHQRHTGEAGSLLRYKFRQGRMDHSLGCDPSFEIFKCLLRIPQRPFVIGCIARLMGFFWSSVRRDEIPVSDEFVAYLRHEQRARLVSLFKGRGVNGSTGTRTQNEQ
jgi:GT2 family glycosyltransferase